MELNRDFHACLLLADSEETEDRVIALEILGQIFSGIYENNSGFVQHSIDNQLKAPVCFAIFTRCDDISPTVRTKGLIVLSQNMKHILKFLDETKDQATFAIEYSENVNEIDLDVNGNHRYFWYLLKSFKERRKQLIAILHKRIQDSFAVIRKTAVIALTNMIIIDDTFVTKENLKCLESLSNDDSSLVKKQLIQSLVSMLETYKNNMEIQDLWLKCILRLTEDFESSVQLQALSSFESLFLHRIFSSVQEDIEFSMTLLSKFSSGNFFAYQTYLKKIFTLEKLADKLMTPQVMEQLVNYVGTEFEEYIWFYISFVAVHCSPPSVFSELCVDYFKNFENTGKYPSFMDHVMKVLIIIFQNWPLETLNTVQSIISNGLETFTVPVELIPIHIEVLLKMHQCKGAETEFAEFSLAITHKCQDVLAQGSHSEELLARYFCTTAEFCQLYPQHISTETVSLLRSFCTSIELSTTPSTVFPLTVKAHVFAALGKLCLQDETLARELLPVFAEELLKREHGVIRNNVTVILCDMCKCYPAFTDCCVPLITLCLKDESDLNRYQTIVLLKNLLQNGCIKWQASLFFGLLFTLADKIGVIRQIGRYNLCEFLPNEKKYLYFNYFIDSIFVLNNFPPSDNEKIAQNVRNLQQFSIPGDHTRKRRMILYRFLLDSMDIKEKANLTGLICDVLTNIAESVYSLEKRTESIIRDCFAILTCNEIRILHHHEILDEAAENEFSRTELDIRRFIIEPIISVVINLKKSITDPESDLIRDIILFLKDLLRDFTNEVKDILAKDQILLKQLELEIKNDFERKRRRNARRKKLLEASGKQLEEDSITLEKIQEIINKACKCLSLSNKRKCKQKEESLPFQNVSRNSGNESQLTIDICDRPSTSTGIF